MTELKRFKLKDKVKDGKLVSRKIPYDKRKYDGNEFYEDDSMEITQ